MRISIHNPCPVCGKDFPSDILATHASSCGEIQLPSSGLKPETLQKALEEVNTKEVEEHEKHWNLRILKQDFIATAMENLEEAEEEWMLPLRVMFIGEEGIDSGGLTREFFSLLFKESPVFDGTNFSVKPDLLKNKAYTLIGKAVAKALIAGHPGPRCLNPHISKYILSGKEPDFSSVLDHDLPGDAAAAIKQIQEATETEMISVFDATMSTLEPTGFSKQLNQDNKMEAVNAIRAHFTLYRVMAPVQQFMEGLQFKGVLHILRTYPDESFDFFSNSTLPSAEDLMNFYVPQFSSGSEKILEERVVYNLDRFLRKIEKKKISSVWIDPMKAENEESNIDVDMGQVLQSTIGCQTIPKAMSKGIIEFDHTSKCLSTINTCLPSITFRNLQYLQNYENFQTEMLRLVVESYGFGCA